MIQVDAQYKSELKDLFDVYYGRFRAELRSEMAALRAELIKWMSSSGWEAWRR